MKFKAYILAVPVLAVLAAVALFADIKPADPASTTPSYKYVDVSADKSRYKFSGSEILILTGNVKIIQGDTVMTADRAEYNKDEDVQTAVATGNVHIVDPDNDITSEKGTAYFNKKVAVLEGNVKVVAKPKSNASNKGDSSKKTAKSEFKDKATITCDKIEYFYKKKEANASGNLKVTQKDRVLTAEKAHYQVKDEILSLSGGVKARDSKGQLLSAPSLTASIKEGDEWIEMEHAVGTFRVETKDLDEDNSTKPADAAPTTMKVETKGD